MAAVPDEDGGSAAAVRGDGSGAGDFPTLVEEFRRRNASAVTMDVLYLFTTAFLGTLGVRGFWPAVIAVFPLVTFLYFAWKSSRAFFLANLVTVVLAAVATEAGLAPL